MTVTAFLSILNNTYSINDWPKTLEVDADTYANCCDFIFKTATESHRGFYFVALGPNKGLMFKDVELILKS